MQIPPVGKQSVWMTAPGHLTTPNSAPSMGDADKPQVMPNSLPSAHDSVFLSSLLPWTLALYTVLALITSAFPVSDFLHAAVQVLFPVLMWLVWTGDASADRTKWLGRAMTFLVLFTDYSDYELIVNLLCLAVWTPKTSIRALFVVLDFDLWKPTLVDDAFDAEHTLLNTATEETLNSDALPEDFADPVDSHKSAHAAFPVTFPTGATPTLAELVQATRKRTKSQLRSRTYADGFTVMHCSFAKGSTCKALRENRTALPLRLPLEMKSAYAVLGDVKC